MMMHLDEQLSTLREQTERKRRLEVLQKELCGQIRTLTDLTEELAAIKLDEQADVDRLEGRTLAAFFFNLVGTMDEKLSKERREAYAAQMKYESAARELAAAKEDLERCERELAGLDGCREKYEAVMEEKARALKSAGGDTGRELFSLEKDAAALRACMRELREAVTAGERALAAAERVSKSLGDAEGWGTWDVFGGGMMADLAKHSALDEAQAAAQDLQGYLRRFKTELADVTVHVDMQVNIEGFLLFADCIFDWFVADWAVLDKIHRSQEQVWKTIRQIEDLLTMLHGRIGESDRKLAETEERRNALVHNAKILSAE